MSIINRLPCGNVTNSSSGSSSMNLFVQLNEPEIKEGVWLQTNNTYDNVLFDNSVVTNLELLDRDNDGFSNLPFNAVGSAVVTVDNDIYIFGTQYSTYSSIAYKYTPSTNTYTQLSNIPNSFSYGSAIAIGTDIYLFGSIGSPYNTYTFKYDTLTDTYLRMADIPIPYWGWHSLSVVDTDIYLMGNTYWYGSATNRPYCRNIYKYDSVTNAFTKIIDIPYDFYLGSTVSIGTDIYLLGGVSGKEKSFYKFDTITKEFNPLQSLPYSFSYNSAISINSTIYFFGDNNQSQTPIYKYDTLTNTFEDLFTIDRILKYSSVSVCKNNIFIFGGELNSTYLDVIKIPTKTYKDGTLLFSKSNETVGKYNTQFFTSPYNMRIASGFDDVWISKDGKLQEYPCYYGDGTKWIKFKN